MWLHQRLYHGAMQFSDVLTPEESQPYYLPRVEEEVEISDNMAVISVPPPRFRPGDPAYILHDFHRVKLGVGQYLVLSRRRSLELFGSDSVSRSWRRTWTWLWGPASWSPWTPLWCSPLRTSLTSSHSWWWETTHFQNKMLHFKPADEIWSFYED